MKIPAVFEKLNKGTTLKVGVILLNDFSMMAFSNSTEPLRALNRILQKDIFEPSYLGFNATNKIASNGINVNVQNIFEVNEDYDIYMFIGGYYNNDTSINEKVISWIRDKHYKGKTFIAVSGASYLLAKTKILDGKKCTIHWEYLDIFKEENPDIITTDNIYEVDGNIITVSGGSAAFDLMLLIAEQYFGQEIATDVADQFIHQKRRSSDELQHSTYIEKYGIHNEKMIQILHYMENHIEDPISINDIANLINISSRQINRLFTKYLNEKPYTYYLNMRLKKAQSYLQSTSMPISQISIACGFSSFSHFSKAYKNLFTHSPKMERELKNAS
ncbi:MAG: GlxA family transcriptional regulator [Alphaproteobacteria bacterium]